MLDLPEVGHRFDHGELAVDLIFNHELDFTDRLIPHAFLAGIEPVVDPPHDSLDEDHTEKTDDPWTPIRRWPQILPRD